MKTKIIILVCLFFIIPLFSGCYCCKESFSEKDCRFRNVSVDSVITFTIDSVNLVRTDTCTILTYNLCVENLTEFNICLWKVGVYPHYRFQINDTIIETNYHAILKENKMHLKKGLGRINMADGYFSFDTILKKSKSNYKITFSDYYYSTILSKLNIEDSFKLKHFYESGIMGTVEGGLVIIGDCRYLASINGKLLLEKDIIDYHLNNGAFYLPIYSNTFYWKQKKE